MIYLIDNNKNPYGHSVVYRQSLLQIKETKHLDIDVNINKKYRFDSTFLRTFYALRKQLLAIPKGNIVHLLFADYYYKIPFASKYLKRNKTIITLHNYPTVWWRKLLLINFCKSIYRVIVHSDFIKSQLLSMGIKNVICINYPSFYNYRLIDTKPNIKKKYGIQENCIVLSSLGAIRPDKGLDILLNAFQFINTSIRKRIILNVAGLSYGYFMPESEIERLCDKYGIQNRRLTIRGLSDKEFMENVIITDILVLPYRKEMTGNSGPMTEAIVNKIPCIGPKDSNIGNLIIKYNLGYTFEMEDAQSLAKAIESIIERNKPFEFSFAEELSEEIFVNKHMQLYSSLT